MATPELKIYINQSKCCYIGRPKHFTEDIPETACPIITSTGFVSGPGDRFEDMHGALDLLNNNQGARTVLCYGLQADVEADLKTLRVPAQARKGLEGLGFSTPDGKVGVVFHGTQYVMKDITKDHSADIEKSNNRLASFKSLADLTEAVETKDQIIAKLKEQLAASQRGEVKQAERAVNVAKGARV